LNLLDSSGWLEYLLDSPLADTFEPVLQKPGELIVPSIVIYEVVNKLLFERDEDYALTVAVQMRQGKVVNVDAALAVYAARVGKDYRLPMADSIIYATALLYDCTLWTTDQHFEGLPGARYFAKSG
jgi:predicted nucleic acid-binding protein